MLEYFANSLIMHRNAAVISVTCMLLCLTFNYTFPLHRDVTKWNLNPYANRSRICDRSDHRDKNAKRSKMSSNIEMALKRLKDSTQDFSKNIQAHFNPVKPSFTEEDLRQYEQLVIMKKNPFLDLQEIGLRYSPHEKHSIRQSDDFNSEKLQQKLVEDNDDPTLLNAADDEINVEIINRGLTGFAIPEKIVKNSNSKLGGVKLDNMKSLNDAKTAQNVIFEKNRNSYIESPNEN